MTFIQPYHISNIFSQICHLEDGAHFGEISLILDEIRVSTVTAVSACEIFTLKKSTFLKVIEGFPEIKEKVFSMAQNKLIGNNGYKIS